LGTDTTPPAAGQEAISSAMLKKPWKRLEVPIIGVFSILLIQALAWASDFLIPVTAAFLGHFVLNSPRRWLASIGIAPVLTAALFTTILAVLIQTSLLEA